MARLIFIGEKFAGRVYEFALEKSSVGRGDHNTLTIEDASVSHSHCEILVYGSEVIVRDLGSSNGTVVDGKRLHKEQQHPLENGQIVSFGSVEARLELSAEAESDTVTGWTAVHAHARYLREKDKSKPVTTAVVKIEGTSAPAQGDKTLIISSSARGAEDKTTSAASFAPPRGKPLSKGFLLVLAVVVGIAAVIIGWAILLKNR